MREKSVLEMEYAGHLKNARDGGRLAESGSENEGSADVMSVDYIGLHIFY